jgi:hypothetical protein
VRNRKKIVKALATAESPLIITLGLDGLSIAATRPSNIKKGAPGACGTSSFAAHDKNSPQSQKLTVGSRVDRYNVSDIIKAVHARKILTFRKLKEGFMEVFSGQYTEKIKGSWRNNCFKTRGYFSVFKY